MKTITLDQAKELKHGQIVYHTIHKNKDGSPQRWKVNGKVQTWKKDLKRVKVPVKFGMYRYDYITEDCLDLISLSPE